MSQQQVIKFNIGGTRYEVSQSLLQTYPESMLTKSADESWHQNPNSEIFIERDGSRFKFVLDYLRDGIVHLPSMISRVSLMMDFDYYGVKNIKEDAIVENVDASYFGRSVILANDVYEEWDTHAKILRDCITIMDSFRKQDRMSLFLKGLEAPCGGYSYTACNDELKKIGLCVEWDHKHLIKGGIIVYDLSLGLI